MWSLSVDVFKAWLGKAWSNQFWIQRWHLSEQEEIGLETPKVPSNVNYSIIL